MKPIADAISRLRDESRGNLAEILESRDDSAGALTRKINSVLGPHLLLSRCSPEELALVEAVYKSEDSVTIGELEKKLSLPLQQLEDMTHACSELLLVYVIKNRQLLTSKMDKVYGIKEMTRVIKPSSVADVRAHALRLAESLMKEVSDNSRLKSLSAEELTMLNILMAGGGCVPADDIILENRSGRWETIESLAKKECITVYHVMSPSLCTVLSVNEDCIPLITTSAGKKTEDTVNHNGYLLVHNILRAYDTISTNGLFYTKQNRFRRIDLKRIADSTVPLKSATGEILESEITADLCIYLLHQLGCISLKRDVAEISLKNISRDIKNPAAFSNRVLSVLEPAKPGGEAFPSPLTLPTIRCLKGILRIMTSHESMHRDNLRWILTSYFLGEKTRKINEFHADVIELEWKRAIDALNFMCIAGLLDTRGPFYSLSDAGRENAELLLRAPGKKTPPIPVRCLYINPDYTIMIPTAELSSAMLYLILSYVEITQEDVMLHGAITRTSIMRAEKRGMHVKAFLETLESCSRNEIPQNLNFVLTEWAHQTMKITVTAPVLLHCTHPGFIDEILYGDMKDMVIERIAPNYILIHQDHIEEIVRLARKKDALISLFEE